MERQHPCWPYAAWEGGAPFHSFAGAPQMRGVFSSIVHHSSSIFYR